MSWTIKRTASDGTIGFQAIYRDPSGKKRSAGTFPSRREATAEGRRAESRVESGVWIDRTSGRTTFNDYVEKVWWPSRQLEVSTRAGYRSYLDTPGQVLAEVADSADTDWLAYLIGTAHHATSSRLFDVFFGALQFGTFDLSVSTVRSWVDEGRFTFPDGDQRGIDLTQEQILEDFFRQDKWWPGRERHVLELAEYIEHRNAAAGVTEEELVARWIEPVRYC